MNIVSYKCSHCGADLELDLDNLSAKCPYCRKKLVIDMDNIEEVLAEKEKTKRSKEKTKRKQLQMLKEENEAKRKSKKTKRIVILCVILVILAVGGYFAYSVHHSLAGDVKIPISSYSVEEEQLDYKDVETAFKKSGFKNIVLEKEGMLKIDLRKKGVVTSVSIDGDTSFSKGEWSDKNALVRIVYRGK